jgi:TonB family protein
MIEEEKQRISAVALSLVFHLLVFIVAAVMGLFAMVTYNDQPDDIVDVMMEEPGEEGGNAGGASPGGGKSGPEAPAVADGPVIAVPSVDKLPEIAEEYTKQPEKQREYRQQHETAEEKSVENHGNNAADGGNGTGTSNGTGTGSGTGNGNGTGSSGTGTGNGMGNGSGNGTGKGNGPGNGNGGNGRDEAAAQAPKTRPQLISGPAAVYPSELIDEEVEGSVVVSIVVGRSGGAESVSLASSSGYPAMDSAAVAAAREYVFTPALNVYGEPVRCMVTRRINFSLR